MTHDIETARIYPTLRCKDAEAMIGWLKTVIGFTEHVVYRDGGVIHHAELAYGSSMLMLGQSRDDAYGRLVGDATGPPHRFNLHRRRRSRRPACEGQGGGCKDRNGTA